MFAMLVIANGNQDAENKMEGEGNSSYCCSYISEINSRDFFLTEKYLLCFHNT